MYLTKSIIFWSFGIVVFTIICGRNNAEYAGIAFPETDEQSPALQNAMKRKPLYFPGKCGENELYYPGDKNDEWVCDCGPGFLYHATTDKCAAAYRRGPCNYGEYLVLREGSVLPECSRNFCQIDGWVLFRNKCYELNKKGPCVLPELSFIVAVNVTTMKLDCLTQSQSLWGSFINRLGDEDEVNQIEVNVTTNCPPGGRKYTSKQCS